MTEGVLEISIKMCKLLKKPAWPSKIEVQSNVTFDFASEYLHFFQNMVDNFEVVYKTCSILVFSADSLSQITSFVTS